MRAAALLNLSFAHLTLGHHVAALAAANQLLASTKESASVPAADNANPLPPYIRYVANARIINYVRELSSMSSLNQSERCFGFYLGASRCSCECDVFRFFDWKN